MTTVTNKTKTGAVGAPPAESSWPVARAKAHLSEVLDRARDEGPQVITRHGRPAVVVVATEEWERKTRQVGTLADFFAASPLRDNPELNLERLAGGLRPLDL